MKKLIIIGALLVMLSGCVLSDKYLDKRSPIPTENLQIVLKGEYQWQNSHVKWEEKEGKLVGYLHVNHLPGAANWLSLTLRAYFVGENGWVRVKRAATWGSSANMGEDLHFEIDIPTNHGNLKYVFFTWNGRYDG